jgi:hypothetical protein
MNASSMFDAPGRRHAPMLARDRQERIKAATMLAGAAALDDLCTLYC